MPSPGEQAFLYALAAEPRLKIPYDRLLALYRQAFPEARDEPRQRAALMVVLERAERDGRIALPRGKAHWIPGSPAMPRWVRSVPHTVVSTPPEQIVWVPAMAFAAGFRDRRGREDARAINTYLKRRGASPVRVPSRERSLAIFGDEKRLDALADATGHLFDGRLSLEQLDCFRVPLPLPYEIPPGGAHGQPLLVLENHHSYWSFCAWNRQAHRYAAVAYGSGNAFRTSVENLDRIAADSGAAGLKYLGDLDLRGLEIPARVYRRRTAAGLAPLEPEYCWYRWLLTHGPRRNASPGSLSSEIETLCADWLGTKDWPDVRALLLSGQRIPQEALGLVALDALTHKALAEA